MCGHYGYITKQSETLSPAKKRVRRAIVRALALAMQERGDHATGMATVFPSGVLLYKRAIPASEFLEDDETKKLLRKAPALVIGHTRYATMGAKTDENAHPFQKGNIVGAHNGHISNWYQLDPTATVDSEAVFTVLDKAQGNPEALKQVQGSCALAWLNLQSPNILHLVAHENPMTLCRVPSLSTVFYCSTPEAMKIVMEASGVVHNAPFEATEDTVYTIDAQTNITKQKVSFTASVVSHYASMYPAKPDTTAKQSNSLYDVCGNCKLSHEQLTESVRKMMIYYDYDTDEWVCDSCRATVADMGTYVGMLWEDVIEWREKLVDEDYKKSFSLHDID